MEPVRIGCSGWVYKDWRGAFYPEKLPQRSWLEHYAGVFDTVEVNNTFYRLPSEEAVKGWAEQTPAGFEFTIKGSRYTTHIKRLREFEKYSERFFERLVPLTDAGKLGVCLWQLPPNFKQTSSASRGPWRSSRRDRSGRRSSSGTSPGFARTPSRCCATHDAALVIGDDPRFPFVTRDVPASWAYVRFHRGAHGIRGKYAPGELDTWRRRIAAWRRNKPVYAYFNNDWEGFAPENARSLAASFS